MLFPSWLSFHSSLSPPKKNTGDLQIQPVWWSFSQLEIMISSDTILELGWKLQVEESSEHTVSKSSDEEATRVAMNLGEISILKYIPVQRQEVLIFYQAYLTCWGLHLPSFSHKFGNGNLVIPLFSLGLITQKKKNMATWPWPWHLHRCYQHRLDAPIFTECMGSHLHNAICSACRNDHANIKKCPVAWGFQQMTLLQCACPQPGGFKRRCCLQGEAPVSDS